MGLFENGCERLGFFGARIAFDAAAIDALDRADDRAVAALAAFDGFGDFAHSGLGAGSIDGEGEEVALCTGGGLGDGVELGVDFGLVAVCFEAGKLVELHAAHSGIVDLQHGHVFVLIEMELVDANDGLRAAVDAGLRIGGGFLNAQLGQAFLDGLAHATHGFDFLDMGQGLGGEVVR